MSTSFIGNWLFSEIALLPGAAETIIELEMPTPNDRRVIGPLVDTLQQVEDNVLMEGMTFGQLFHACDWRKAFYVLSAAKFVEDRMAELGIAKYAYVIRDKPTVNGDKMRFKVMTHDKQHAMLLKLTYGGAA